MRVFLLQGQPGIGKTTIARAVVSQDPKLRHLQMGDYLQAALGGQVSDREDMRSRASELLTDGLMRDAIGALREDIATELRNGVTVLVEARDVGYRPYGARGFPTSLSLVRGMNCGGIILLVATVAEVQARFSSRNGSPRRRSSIMFDHYDSLQRAYSASASAELGCSLHLVDAEAPAETVAQQLRLLMHASLEEASYR